MDNESVLHPEEREVVNLAQRLDGLLGKGLDWSNTYLPEASRSFTTKNLSSKRSKVAKILESAKRPIALGVFGSSQCGKSYLVSELARGEAASLLIEMNPPKAPPQTYDYLVDINPAGGRESTGVVTRFTKRPYQEVSGCSAMVRFLSRVDLIKIFMNGYIYECQPDFTPSLNELVELKKTLRNAKRESVPVFTSDDIWDLKDYVDKHLQDLSLRALNEIDYWGFLHDEVRFLSFDAQIPVLEWLWGKFSKLTDLYRLLHKTLGGLGDQIAGVYNDALMPREQSIIDIQRLTGLSKTSNRKCSINVAGQNTEMDSAFLCALTRELILKVPSQSPASLLDQMDLLDFPGARSRNRSYDNKRLGEAGGLVEVFLRGKVALLFDRFSDDLDVTGLVLCQENGPQEAKSLPSMVNNWIGWSHGIDTKARQGKPVTLFHVFTKFDLDLLYKKGEDPQVRWESRLKTNFADFFGRNGEDWIVHWDETGPFRNCFWVRNPSVQQTVFSIKNGLEVPINEDYLNQTRTQFCNHGLVKQHFPNPEQAWDKSASPNNCGVAWLMENIRRTIPANAKVKQLLANLNILFNEAKNSLRQYYVGDDVAAARTAAEERALSRLKALGKVMAAHYSLSTILDRERLTISEKAVALLYDLTINPMCDDASNQSEQESEVASSTPLFSDDEFAIDGVEEDPKPTQTKVPEKASVRKGDIFARAVMQRWQEQLIRMSNDPELHKRTGLDGEWYTDIAQELIKASARLKLTERISENSDRRLNSPNPTRLMRLQAVATSTLLNRFVLELGHQRPFVKIPDGPPCATLKHYPGKAIYKHWTDSLRELYKDNVSAGQVVNEASNSMLKSIIEATLNA